MCIAAQQEKGMSGQLKGTPFINCLLNAKCTHFAYSTTQGECGVCMSVWCAGVQHDSMRMRVTCCSHLHSRHASLDIWWALCCCSPMQNTPLLVCGAGATSDSQGRIQIPITVSYTVALSRF